MTGEQGKLGQAEERIRVGAGWEDGNMRHRTKSLKQGRTALSRAGALKIYTTLFKEKAQCSCTWLGCKHKHDASDASSRFVMK